MEKVDLSDVRVLIPLRIDSYDRLRNVELVIKFILKNFKTVISVLEVDNEPRLPNELKAMIDYKFLYSDSPVFHRTKANNILIRNCNSEFGIIYDSDVIINPVQILEAIESLRSGRNAIAFPYDGRFIDVDRFNKEIFAKCLSFEFLEYEMSVFRVITFNSVGGCFIFNTNIYKKCGMDNEGIVGWGHDDAERVKRLKTMGYPAHRVKGAIFHLYHKRGGNSFFFSESHAVSSYERYLKTCSLSQDELLKEIESWEWM